MKKEFETKELQEWAKSIMRDNPKFIKKGRSRQGIDCWGLVCLAYKDILGIELPDFMLEYDSTQDARQLAKIFTKNMPLWQKVSTPKAGDVIVLRIKSRPLHAGLCLGNKQFLHIEKDINVGVEKYTSLMWQARVDGFFRYTSLCLQPPA